MWEICVSFGQILVIRLSIGPADGEVFPPKLAAQFVEVQHGGETRPIAHQQSTFAVVEIAAGPGDDDADLALKFLLFPGVVLSQQLLIDQPSRQHQQAGGDREVEKEEARVAGLEGFNEASGRSATCSAMVREGVGRRTSDSRCPAF
jgi:hypothetical protein